MAHMRIDIDDRIIDGLALRARMEGQSVEDLVRRLLGNKAGLAPGDKLAWANRRASII